MAPEKKIPNAFKRSEVHRKSKREKAQAKLKRRMEIRKAEKEKGVGEELKRQRLATNIPRTIDNTRIYDSSSYLTADPKILQAAEARAAEASRAVNGITEESDGEDKNDESDESGDEDEDEEMPEAGPSTLPTPRKSTEESVGDDEAMVADAGDELEQEAAEEPTSTATLPPRILITTSPGAIKSTYLFCDDLKAVFPGGSFFKRPKGRGYEMGRVAPWAAKRGFNAVIVVNEDHKKPNAITLINLPAGPTAYFKLSSVTLGSEIAGHARPSPHSPELILNNFTTLLGNAVGRLFGSLFPPLPQFRGRQVVTLHNQRDFLFFRRHRYMFASPTSAKLQEIGPRFTLKLRWLRKGLPTVSAADGRPPSGGDAASDEEEVDEAELARQEKMDEDEAVGEMGAATPSKADIGKKGMKELGIPALDEEQEYEWKWKPKMEVSRRTFFL